MTAKAAKQLSALPLHMQKRIVTSLQRLCLDPYAAHHAVKALHGGEGYRLRVGDYRLVYHIEDARLIISVVRIAHRREVYR
jgi:mRNA interferase RelE/StbE